MKITGLKTDYQVNPLGIDLTGLTLTWQVEDAAGSFPSGVRVVISDSEDFRRAVYDSDTDVRPASEKERELCSGVLNPEVTLLPGRTYYWKVWVRDDSGDEAESAAASFEGGHPTGGWRGCWIRPAFTHDLHPVLRRTFRLSARELQDLAKSRLYVIGLGLYEAYLNGQKIGNQYLTPYFTDYRYWAQYQTYDVLSLLQEGENTLDLWLGNGWYKGRFGYLAGGQMREYYGDQFAALANLYLWSRSGESRVICTDESWSSLKSPVISSGIYDGEVLDGRKLPVFVNEERRLQQPDPREVSAVLKAGDAPEGGMGRASGMPSFALRAMRGLPVTAHEVHRPAEIFVTPRQEVVIDFGQEVTGWTEFTADLPADAEVRLDYGEVLQDGCFYRDNLRSADASFRYVSDGMKRRIRPHFTFYGFRYVRVTGLTAEEAGRADFAAVSLYSDMEDTGTLETGNEKVNRLVSNTRWGEKDNFVDIPTDCPQRDERCGWTGDAQIFCSTASWHCETAAFYRKYLTDMNLEQREKSGAVPYVVPDVLTIGREKMGEPPFDFAEDHWGEAGAAVWGDAATIIPWTVYGHFANRAFLAEAYPGMKAWTDFIYAMDEEHCGGSRLWTCGFHFGDWLSLDVEGDAAGMDNREGGTDKHFVASVYYMYSADLTARAAHILGLPEDEAWYHRLSQEVRNAVRGRYVQGDGKLTISSQTAYALAIHFGLFDTEEENQEAGDMLAGLVHDWKDHLATGFVGTAFICSALTRTGHAAEAFTLLLNEDYPSWLYEVNMGATTVWERWNSILPDGHISGTGMNSLNHYAYGCITQWLYEEVCGIGLPEYAEKAGENDGSGAEPPESVIVNNGTAAPQASEMDQCLRIRFAPHTDERLGCAAASVRTYAGTVKSGWKLGTSADGRKEVEYTFTVPFGCTAEFEPDLFSGTDRIELFSGKEQPAAGGSGDGDERVCLLTPDQLRNRVFTKGTYRVRMTK